MALQQRLGILPERRIRSRPCDRAAGDFAALAPNFNRLSAAGILGFAVDHASGVSAGSARTLPFGLKRDPWHGQSLVASAFLRKATNGQPSDKHFFEASKKAHAVYRSSDLMKRKSLMKLEERLHQAGAAGYILLWLLGIPIPVLFIIFLLRGCS